MKDYEHLKTEAGRKIFTMLPYDAGQDRIVEEQGYYGLDFLLAHINPGEQCQFNDKAGNPVAFLLKHGDSGWKVVEHFDDDTNAALFVDWSDAFWYAVTLMDKRKDVPHFKDYEMYKDENATVEYLYELRCRPFSFNTQPDGCVGVEPGVHFGFSTVIYNRMLTNVEIDHFSLEPIGWRLPCA